jgi:hypothetical protein
MPLHRWFVLVVIVTSVGVAAAVEGVAAEAAVGSGQPSNRLGLVKDHDPVKYVGDVVYFVEDKIVGRDKLTQTWSIVARKEGKAEHAFKVETHAIHSDADAAKQELPRPVSGQRSAENPDLDSDTRMAGVGLERQARCKRAQ